MTDQDVIADAYKDVIKTVFATFYSACAGKGNIDSEEAAEKFQKGIQFARQVRDKAIKLLAAS